LNEPAIDKEKKIATARGDHFAPGGDNDRLWTFFQKHAREDPVAFVEYYSNKLLQVCCMAWYMDASPAISVGSQVCDVRSLPGTSLPNQGTGQHRETR
jgi:hypothetical protein